MRPCAERECRPGPDRLVWGVPGARTPRRSGRRRHQRARRDHRCQGADGAGAAPAQKDPIVYLDGGPGGSSIANAVYYGGWSPDGGLKALLAKRDLIAIDLRGTGGSTPTLACPAVSIERLGPSGTNPGDFSQAAITECRQQLLGTGATLSAYGTAAAARDVELALGTLAPAGFNLVGVSYGARVALEIMRRSPPGLRAVVLDSLAPPGMDVLLEEGSCLRPRARGGAGRCEADPACVAAAPGVRTALAEIVDRAGGRAGRGQHPRRDRDLDRTGLRRGGLDDLARRAARRLPGQAVARGARRRLRLFRGGAGGAARAGQRRREPGRDVRRTDGLHHARGDRGPGRRAGAAAGARPGGTLLRARLSAVAGAGRARTACVMPVQPARFRPCCWRATSIRSRRRIGRAWRRKA